MSGGDIVALAIGALMLACLLVGGARYVRGWVWALRSRACCAREDWPGMAAACDRLIRLAPDDHRMHHARAHALCRQRRFEDALADLSKAMELNPSAPPSALYLIDRGTANLCLGRHRAALDDFDRAAAAQPGALLEEIEARQRYARSLLGLEKSLQTAMHEQYAEVENRPSVASVTPYAVRAACGYVEPKELALFVAPRLPDGSKLHGTDTDPRVVVFLLPTGEALDLSYAPP